MNSLSIAVATNNPHKIEEIKHYFSNSKIELLTPKNLGIIFEVEENGNSFKENALIKSEKLFKATKFPSIADDSGICVDCLDGEPGIYSARYGEPNFTDKDRTLYLLSKVQNYTNRLAHYECVISLSTKLGNTFFEGRCYGEIAFDYDETGNGFGYDPIFFYPPLQKRFSQITREVKSKISHRGIALQKLNEYIQENF
ncbi:MAG: RdgB/HAM1 family non-canonical purine NTP pyrophosphatase [Leptospiraceae bacterium]|nr:RdgB/HAM1 family non-canonical purine NTP pyrophosphatase [Leptospiraceae bacterium]MCK6379789.1 RdgB/HAM1 family non-canonical purine NTP pyrophosphatase [Leptospiraceae bacterium]NUM41356.1 RdgB/HAM1 family non-canonical purine NTP pyrophosphatase [Leptospiraceae bacterium]